MSCIYCGAVLEPNDTICPHCGKPRAGAPTITTPSLTIDGPQGRLTHPLGAGTFAIGRAADNLVALLHDEVSRHHAEIRSEGDHFLIVDLGSKNGTVLNGTRLAQQRPEPFVPGDTIEIGPFVIHLDKDPAPQSVGGTQQTLLATQVQFPAGQALAAPPLLSVMPGRTSDGQPPGGRLDLAGRTLVKIGRAPDNDIVIDHPQASRYHALVERENDVIKITDLGSTNGTFVNGQRIIAPQILQDGDTVQIAAYKLEVHPDHIHHADQHGNISVDALHLVKTVGKGIEILTDVSLAVQPREFVAIVGGSGAGKTTLMDALNGFRPATRGTVLYNNADLYRHFDAYRNVIGYVPQDDIIHRELTVHGALSYAAELRLPRDTSHEERQQRINEVLHDLGLESRRDTPISRLSGGQRKRVSIGVELLNKPSLLFLDEPTSGLDPSTETKMMRLLRELADQGHTILLVTHVTGNVSLCDKVAIMASGGRLAFFGPPPEALTFFQVRDFVDIYDKLDNSKPEELKQRYEESPQHEEYVARPLTVHVQPATGLARSERIGPGFKRISAFRQFTILSRRNLEILLRDRASLVLMLLIAPALGLLDVVTWKANLFDVQGGNSIEGITVLFITALDCVLVGSLASMREIVKETEVYRRERMVGLGIVPYLSSKVWLGVVLALYQALMFVLFKVLVITSLPHDPVSLGQMYVTLTLTTLGGMLMGLFISAISPNQNVAPLLTILLLVPQIIFGGGVLPASALPNGELVGRAMISKWGFDGLVTISGLGQDVANDVCWQVATARADPAFHPAGTKEDVQILQDWQATLSQAYQEKNCSCLGSNIFSACKFPGILTNYTAADRQAVNSKEPAKPVAPGNPPPQPGSPLAAPQGPGAQPICNQLDPACQQQLKDWQSKFALWQSNMTGWTDAMNVWKSKMDDWKKQMDAYQQETNRYQDGMETWQTRYKDWKEKRDTAIGNAQALVRKTFDDYGQFFQMNLLEAWGALAAIIAVFFGLIFVAQKYKDIAGR